MRMRPNPKCRKEGEGAKQQRQRYAVLQPVIQTYPPLQNHSSLSAENRTSTFLKQEKRVCPTYVLTHPLYKCPMCEILNDSPD